MLKPEPKSDPPDQLFLLAPTVIQKSDIEVFANSVSLENLCAVNKAFEKLTDVFVYHV